MKNKKGANIIAGNIIFIVLNLVFLTILILFVFMKAGGAAILEEKYSKQIALMIDSAEPIMKIKLNMYDAIEKAKDEGFDVDKIVRVDGNIVTVQLRENGGYSYSFFNDVDVGGVYRDGDYYLFIINNYLGEQNE